VYTGPWARSTQQFLHDSFQTEHASVCSHASATHAFPDIDRANPVSSPHLQLFNATNNGVWQREFCFPTVAATWKTEDDYLVGGWMGAGVLPLSAAECSHSGSCAAQAK
jgi:hypothetical protein